MRREVFFFRSQGVELYGSLYASAQPSRPYGLVACGSWGVEADRSDPLLRTVAIAMARLGGAGLVFHYPGYGDSFGTLAENDLTDLSKAACDAVEEASRRCPGLSWTLAGFMFGASVAAHAQARVAAETLLLVQPALQPAAYFQGLLERRQPLPLPASSSPAMEFGTAPGMAYGYPVPRRIAHRGEEGDEAVLAALDAFEGDGAVIRHARPQTDIPVPERFEVVEVPGTWRFGAHNNPPLASATTDWLDRRTTGRHR